MSGWDAAINKCIQGDYFQTKKFFKRHSVKKIAKKLDKYAGWLVRTIWGRIIEINERKIVFLSFNKQYTCNPKYICEEIINRSLDYELVWITAEETPLNNCVFPACVRRVKAGTVEAFQEILSAKVIVQNGHLSQELGFIPKKANQYYIQTWHGSLGIKRFDSSSDRVKDRVSAAKRAGKLNDLFLSNSTFESEKVAPVFWNNSEICEWGHARNDILIRNDKIQISGIRKTLLIPDNTKIALYAPTFRDSKSMEHYEIDYERLISALKARFGGEWMVLIKFHYSNRKMAGSVKSDGNVVNVSKYNDIQELMLIADVGITDYSSWIFDYMLMRKPAFLYADDIFEYENERGFYYPLSTTPFPIASTNEELEHNIINFIAADYQAKVDTFLKEKGCIEDGYAAQRAVDRIEQIMNCVNQENEVIKA